MLKINLLPPTARKAAPSAIEQFHRTPLMWMLVGVLVLAPLLLWVPVSLRHRQLRELQASISALRPKKLEVEQLQQSLQQLRSQESAFRELQVAKILWSKRLNVLSDVTPDGVWFTDLSFDQKKGLVLEGAAIGQDDPELVGISKVVQGLKAESEFSSAVKEIQIESIKRIQDGEVEVVQFTLTCTFLEVRAL